MLLSPDRGLRLHLQVNEDLPVELTICIKVEQLGSSGCSGSLLFTLLLLLCFLVFVGLLHLLFPLFLHLSHQLLITFVLLFRLLEFLFSFRVGSCATSHGELLFEPRVLLHQLSDHLVLLTLVDDRLVLDCLGPVGVLERVEGLFVVGGAGSDGADHNREGVSSQ